MQFCFRWFLLSREGQKLLTFQSTMDTGSCFISEFSALKVSALSKAKLISVNEVTIGPNSRSYQIGPALNNTRKQPMVDSVDYQTTSKDTTKGSPKCVAPLLHANHSHHHTALMGIEKARKENELELFKQHEQTIIMFHKQMEALHVLQWKQQEAEKLQEIQHEVNIIIQSEIQVELESMRKCENASAKNEKRHHLNNQLLKSTAEEHEKIQKCRAHFTNAEQELLTTISEIEILFKKNQEANSELTSEKIDFTNQCNNYKNLTQQVQATNIREQDISVMNDILNQCKQLKISIRTIVKNHYEKRERLAAERVALARQGEKEAKVKQVANTAQAPTITEQTSASFASQMDDKDLLTNYLELQDFLKSHQQSYKQLLDDQSYKQFKFNCKKAVNIPVNAISAVSSDHLRDKYTKLHDLLAGKTVQISDNRINAAQHPQGIAFVTDLLAKKFILQGDLTISSNPDAAFAYGTIIVTLWNDFPIFGKLLLAHFYKDCPYLVPIYFQQQEQQSDEEFYTSMGYQYKDGAIEKQDKFLKRMTGISKLYFSILISHAKRTSARNPHNIAHGWTWFARTLNMEPYVDVTATIIHSFLEVAGSTMQATYGRQFKKLIVYIMKYQIPLLKNKDSGGPLARLEVMLQDYYKTGIMPSSQGMLLNFW